MTIHASITSNPGQTGAIGTLWGSIGNAATWWDDVTFRDPSTGSVVTSASSWTWTLTLTYPGDDFPTLTKTTADDLTISQGSSSTTLQIRVPEDDLSALDGDMICDIYSLDTSQTPDRTRHWFHGTVSVRNEPSI